MTAADAGGIRRRRAAVPYPGPGWARFVSFVLATGMSGLILAYPQVVAESASELHHGALTLLLWGVAAGFVHGVGFVPRLAIWRLLFHPLVAWLAMGGATAWLLIP